MPDELLFEIEVKLGGDARDLYKDMRQLLKEESEPLSRKSVEKKVEIRNDEISYLLDELVEEGYIEKKEDGYILNP